MIILFQPPEGIKSVGEHINLEISIYLQRFPHHQRTLRRLIFDYLLKRECCITGRVLSRFFDQVGHETTYLSGENKHFFTK